MNRRLGGPLAWLLALITAAMMVFILAPLVVTVAISVGTSQFAAFPPRGFHARWYAAGSGRSRFPGIARLQHGPGARRDDRERCVLGVPAAFALARHEFPGAVRCRAALLSPLMFPVLITGVALLQMFATLNSNNTPLNMLIAHVLVTTPYVVRTVTASLMLADTTLEDAARTLGAGRWRVFRRITVPQIAPGLAAGALFAFMVSFDNFPISLWLADAQHNPMPILIFQRIASVFDPSIAAISTLMICWRWRSSSCWSGSSACAAPWRSSPAPILRRPA
jgi:putative spermidine/putrescine transport system permease protein